MKKINIKFVRHGQTTHNFSKKITGHQPGELTQLGCRQAQQIGHYFEKQSTRFDFIYVSDLKRTRQTFENICKAAPYLKDIKTRYTPLVREQGCGILENQPIELWNQNAEK